MAEIKRLEENGCIYKSEGKNYYHLSNDYISPTETITNDVNNNKNDDKCFPKDVDIIEMIKENMLQEQLRDKGIH